MSFDQPATATAATVTSLVHARTDAVRDTIARVKAAGLSLVDPSEDAVEAARAAFLDLAKRTELFPAEQFPYLYETRSGFYRIGEDADHKNALYIQVSRAHGANPPHKHPYWAIITGVQGDEVNVLYERVDDGSVPGKGRLGNKRVVHIRPGVSLYIPNKDFHTINVEGEDEGIHLHFYTVGADTLEHRSVERFKTPDSEDIYVRTEAAEPGVIGVQRLPLADVEAAVNDGRPVAVLAVDHGLDALPVAIAGARRVTLDQIGPGLHGLPEDRATPLILVGEGRTVRIAADRLTRLGYFSTFWFDPHHGR